MLVDTMADQQNQQESVEFLRSKLEEKNEIIEKMQSEKRLSEFKTNKELNALRIQVDNAKNQAKAEKARADKLNQTNNSNELLVKAHQKTIKTITEQNKKQERDNLLIKTQYRQFKEQIKKYQRILPTQAFIDSFSLQIESIPTYEQLYYVLDQKSKQSQRLQQGLEQSRIFVSNILIQKQKIVEEIKQKKDEIEKNFKENAEKLVETENALAALKEHTAQLQSRIQQMEQTIQQYKRNIEQSNDKLEEYKIKISELEDRLSLQINLKESQLRESQQAQNEKHQQQIKLAQEKYQQNEKNLMINFEIVQERFNQKYYALQRQKQKCDDIIQDQRLQQQRLKAKVASNQGLVHSLRQELNEYQNQVESLENRIKIFKEECENKNMEINRLIIELQKVHQRYQLLKRGLSESNENYENKIKQLNEVIATNQAQREQFSNQKTELENLITKLEKQIETLRINRMKSRTNSLEFLNEQEPKIDKSSSNILTLKQQIQKQQINRSKSNTLTNTQQYHRVQEQLREQRLKYQQSSKQVNELKQKLLFLNQLIAQERIDSRQQLKQLQYQLQIMREAEDIYTKRIDELNKLQDSNKYLVSKLNDDLLDQRTTNRNLVVQIQRLEKQVSNYKQEQSDRIKKSQKIRERSETLVTDNSKLINQLKIEREQKVILQKTIKQLQYKLQMNQKNLLQLNANHSTIKNKSQSFLKEIERLHGVMGSSLDKQVKLLQQNKNFKAQISEHTRQNELLKIQIKDFQQKISGMTNQISNQKLKLASVQSKHAELEAIIKNNQILIEHLKKVNEAEKTSKQLFRIPSLREFVDTEQSNVDNTLFLEVQKKDAEIQELQNQISQLKTEVQKIALTTQKQREHLQKECQYYISEIVTMKMKVAETNMLAEQKTYHYNLLKKKYDQLTKK